MELYIIRHGQSTNNALEDPSKREVDSPLTELGRRQAELLAAYLADGRNRDRWVDPATGYSRPDEEGFGITHLYCSAMYRSLQTTQPIARALGIQPEVWIDIHEHGGMYLEQPDGIVGFPGKTRSEILSEFPDYILPDVITDAGWWKQENGQESLAMAQGRAIKVAGELRRRANTPERIAIVSHGTFIDALLKALLNQLPSRQFFFLHYNTAITRIDFSGDRERMLVRYINRTAHLPPDLVS
ncbi:MAG TPA: histidine phosphatase family protein [Oceanobacillus sp.]|nr:histidine phosphatase family protein [Oceanobacillus sp.]